MDDRGKTKLSMKVVDQETGEDLTEKLAAEKAARIASGEEPELETAEGGEREGGDRPRRPRRPRRD
jgi:polyribonucleotide nucleotidyltransferase